MESKWFKEKEKLQELIDAGTSYEEIGRMYGVSDNAVRKWCKKFGLPFRKCDINNISDIDWINV